MNADLEQTLRELGPGYREMVVRMRMCCNVSGECAPRTFPESRMSPKTFTWAVAAAFALTLAVAAVFLGRPSGGAQSAGDDGASAVAVVPAASASPYVLAYGGEGSVDELVRTQRADGSWENDFLTRQNAAALRGSERASVAYRKAVRYLRSRGLAPLPDDEFRARALLVRNS